MSTILLLTKNNQKPARLPNSSDYVRTRLEGIERLKNKLNYTISPDLTLVDMNSILCYESKEQLEAEKNEAYLLLEKINVCQLKTFYDGKKINDADVNNHPDNIKIYDSIDNPHLFKEKFTYYKYLLEGTNYTYPEVLKRNGTSDNLSNNGEFILEEYIRYRGPVVVAQEFYGCGATCTETSEYGGKYGTDPQYDIYDDRITKIWYKETSPERIVIEEYYRASVDTSINKWKKETKNFFKPVGAGVYDFIPGLFTYNHKWNKSAPNTGEPALYVFDYKKNKNKVSEQKRTNLESKYINNTFVNYTDITQDYAVLRENFLAVDGSKKQLILIHRGLRNYTASEGCLTIVMHDADTLKKAEEGDYLDRKSVV